MIIFEYKCRKCEAVFEHAALGGACVAFGDGGVSAGDCDLASDDVVGGGRGGVVVVCAGCGASDSERVFETMFKPNKAFCPKEKHDFFDDLSGDLGEILRNEELKCAGCACEKRRYTLKSFK